MNLELPTALDEALAKTVTRVCPGIEERVGMGGGTVLAARWQHRISIDIDLFLKPRNEFEAVPDDVQWRLIELQRRGGISDLIVNGPFSSWKSDGVPVSLVVAPGSEEPPFDDMVGKRTPVGAWATANILYGKLAGRIAGAHQYLLRDCYDLLVAMDIDSGSLASAISRLTVTERRTLEEDAEFGWFLPAGREIVEPSHPSLQNQETLIDFSRALFGGGFDADRRKQLRAMRRPEWPSKR